MRAQEPVKDLIAILSHGSPELRYWAAYSLGQIGNPESIPELQRVASTDVGLLEDGRSVKEEALEALGTIRSGYGDNTGI